VPAALRYTPFRGSAAIAGGLLTRGQLAGPAWQRMFRGIYRHVDADTDPLAWCQAASLLLPPGAALSHRSAAILYGVNLLGRGDPPTMEVTVPPPDRLRPDAHLIVHRSHLSAAELVRRGGIAVTSPVRTAFDLGRDRDLVAAVVALDALLHQRVVRPNALRAIADERLGCSGVVAFRAAAALARAGAESPMETRLRLLLVAGGLPEPVLQHEVFGGDGWLIARLDLAYRDLRLGLEYDGDHHRDREVFRRDAVRLNRLRLCGWMVLRFTADDVLRHPERVVEQVRVAYEVAASRQTST
jgi:hypothetical protein